MSNLVRHPIARPTRVGSAGFSRVIKPAVTGLPLKYDFLQADDAVIGDATVLGDNLTFAGVGFRV